MAHLVITGESAVVAGVDTVEEWSINYKGDPQSYVASNTKSAMVRVAGNKDWSGSYKAKGHTPVRMPRDTFDFEGAVSGGVIGVSGPVKVRQTSITFDVEAGRIIDHEVQFESNGALDRAPAHSPALTDTTVPDAPSSIGMKIEMAEPIGSPSFSELLDVRTVTITFSANNPSYVSSSTDGQTKRSDGNLDVTLAISVYEADPDILPAEDAIKHVKVFVDATTFWEFKWVMFGEATGLTANLASEDHINATLNASFTGFADVDGTPTEGYIKNPAASTIWPE